MGMCRKIQTITFANLISFIQVQVYWFGRIIPWTVQSSCYERFDENHFV